MAHVSDLIEKDIGAYLKSHEQKSLMRFITCGSVDDGKSTLIGRLLYESKMIFEDQLAALEADSKKVGTQGGDIDFALLVDGLAAEREQGITIDVAYRFFSTDRRKFIVADTPGHEQYTRNMVTGASTADLAVMMIDARKGVLTQTRRHSYLVSLIGIRHVVLAINKLDMMDYSQEVFDRIVADYSLFARQIGISDITAIPMSALKGDNIVERSANMPWYKGPVLMEFLETVDIESDVKSLPFRMPVQWVNRPDLDFRGFSGRIVGGSVKPGDRLRALPSGKESTVTRIVTMDGDLPQAVIGQSITLTLSDEIDVSRGDVLTAPDKPAQVADRFETSMVWMADEPMRLGKAYLLKMGSRVVGMSVLSIRHRVDVNTLAEMPAEALELNEIGICDIALDRLIAFDPYAENRDMGAFIVIDRLTNTTVGAGMLRSGRRAAKENGVSSLVVNKAARAQMLGQKPKVIWMTGLSGAGKSTISGLLEKHLHAMGRHVYLLDGDVVRGGLCRDLGFGDAARTENIRRIGEVAKLMVDAGLIVIVAFISPFRADRKIARDIMQPGEFVEVFVDAPLSVTEARDPKGLYKKARRGEIMNFTGIDSAYEPPENPELRIDTTAVSPEQAVETIIRLL
jgi:bifunctional enzyme CysN/CysC